MPTLFTKLSLGGVALAAATAEKPARPDLPMCQCLEDWPNQGTDLWERSWGCCHDPTSNPPGTSGWGVGTWGRRYHGAATAPYTGQAYVPSTTALGVVNGAWGQYVGPAQKGCVDLGKTWGDGTKPGMFQICTPDTSQGPCIGIGGYDTWLESFYMSCNHTVPLEGDDKRAAQAFEAAYTELVSSDVVCECEDDWSDSALAQTFCGANAAQAGAEGVDSSICMAPVKFDNSVRSEEQSFFESRGASGDAVQGTITPVVADGKKWCKVKQKGCLASDAHTEPCSGELWMTLPNTASVPMSTTQNNEMFATLKALSDSISPSQRLSPGSGHCTPPASDPSCRNPACGCATSYTALTFMPENTATGLFDMSNHQPWMNAIAAASATYDQYSKPSTAAGTQTAKDIEKEQAALAAQEAEVERKAQECADTPACAAKAASQECDALEATAAARFGAFPTPTNARARKDPHLHLAHGDRADFRGEHGSIFNLLSAKNISVSTRMEHTDLKWAKQLVHGTRMAAVYGVVRTSLTGRMLHIEYTATDNHGAGKHAPVATVHEQGQKDITVAAGGPGVAIENVQIALSGSNELTITTTKRWLISAKLTAYPFAKLNPGKRLLDVKIDALYDADHDIVAPHGVIGQSWDGDDFAVDGKIDGKVSTTETTTAAQAEGAIEGTFHDYKVDTPFSVDFKYSRFSALRAASRDVSSLTGKKRPRSSKSGKTAATSVEEPAAVSSAAA